LATKRRDVDLPDLSRWTTVPIIEKPLVPTRKIEIFSTGCGICEEVVEQVKAAGGRRRNRCLHMTSHSDDCRVGEAG
jgi:hypothetical protein